VVYAFFDFDGTLTNKDSLKGFARYYWGKHFYFKLVMFLPYLVLFRLKLLSHDAAKAAFLRHFYKGERVEKLNQMGQRYAQQVLPAIENAAMMNRLQWHIQQKHKVCIVTASLPYWLTDWCKSKGLPLLATKAEEKDGKLTGKLDGKNCFGHEKVHQIRNAYHLYTTDRIYAYGDTESDYPMMDMANMAYDCSNNSHSPYTLARKESWYAEAI